MTIIPEWIYTFNAITVKIPLRIFVETHRSILKFTWKCKRPRVAKTILKKQKTKKLVTLFYLIAKLKSSYQDKMVLAQE